MMPDYTDTTKGGGDLDPSVCHGQWDGIIKAMDTSWKPFSAKRLPRGDYYKWLAGEEIEEVTPIDFNIRCGNERAAYGNLSLTVDLAKLDLSGLPSILKKVHPKPRELRPTLFQALKRLGHMNSIAIVGKSNMFLERETRCSYYAGPDSTFENTIDWLTKLFIPDTHTQPDYRGVTTACAVLQNAEIFEPMLKGKWAEIEIEEVDRTNISTEFDEFWLGAVIVVDETLDGNVVILTNGVTRETAVNWI